MIPIRRLRQSDIPDALVLSDAAGWNQTAEDWSRLISLDPDNCYCIEEDGRVVASCTLLVYGSDLAWVGMVLTHPDYRKRGHARRLLDVALESARGMGIRCVKLDATADGEPIYRSLGFETEQGIERWRREPGPFEAAPIGGREIPFELDAAAFGADRSGFLRGLVSLPHGRGSEVHAHNGDAFALHRPGRRAWYFGPCVSRTPEAAESLARGTLAEHPDEPWFWDILPANEHATNLASRLGFRSVRRLARMWLGEHVQGDDSLVYATSGFEAG